MVCVLTLKGLLFAGGPAQGEDAATEAGQPAAAGPHHTGGGGGGLAGGSHGHVALVGMQGIVSSAEFSYTAALLC